MNALSALERFAGEDTPLTGLAPAQALDLMCRWYVAERADDALPIAEDGDGLLVEWGTFTLDDAPTWQFSVTRQFTARAHGGDEDTEIWQLAVRFHFAPDSVNAALVGARWCFDPARAEVFTHEVRNDPAWSVIIGDLVLSGEIEYSPV